MVVDKYGYSGYGIGFDACSSFSLSNGNSFYKNVSIFGVDNSSFVHVNNKKTDILILGKGSTDGLNETAITTDYNVSNSFLMLMV